MTSDPLPDHPEAAPTTNPIAGDGDGGGAVVATHGRYYRNVRYLLSAGLVAMGLWFAYDGWKAWPAKTARIDQIEQTELPAADARGDTDAKGRLQAELKELGSRHSDTSIRTQKQLAVACPIGGVALLCWTLHNSRGRIRFDGHTLEVPGHPPLPVDAITALDKSKWDRKGIAYAHYDVGGKTGQARLDDFVYERDPIDKIVDRLTALLQGPDETKEPNPDAADAGV
ncbi:MAG TPA: hypothetical protein VK324_12205 [Tepidisphaeraceae bacterium]|nr:hypothetical protein [Tepidisphaeraceae bacterium]